MKVIYYGFYEKSSTLSVLCPNIKSAKVGSVYCQNCDHFHSIHKSVQIVKCTFKKEKAS